MPSTADLERLIQRATPRVEDVRTVDRTDFIRRDHGHLTFREIVDALDALEFSVDTFAESMRELVGPMGGTGAPADTAVHGLLHVVEGLEVLGSPARPASAVAAGAEEPTSGFDDDEAAAEAAPDWQAVVAQAKSRGSEAFKQKDFKCAIAEYTEAIHATPRAHEDLAALYSNRSAALLQAGDATSALVDASRCVHLAPAWPKGYFRHGCCFRQLSRLDEAVRAFRNGQSLEPSNDDWSREVDKTEKLQRAQPSVLVRQLVLQLLPELLRAWIRGLGPHSGEDRHTESGCGSGVLQVQVSAELKDVGMPKWQTLREKKEQAKSQLRYAFLTEKDYLANLAANLQGGPQVEGVGVIDMEGHPLKIAEIAHFVSGKGRAADSASQKNCAFVHIDVKDTGGAGKMVAAVCRVPCDTDEVRRFLAPHKDPPLPKGAVDGVLQLQRGSGFPKALPRFLGFQSMPGDLNFPVIDLKRDAPEALTDSGK